jgi:hypothetical protein
MLPQILGRRRRKRLLLQLAPLMLCGCTSIGDLGYIQPPAVADNIHAWVGQEAALHAGGPISFNNLTEYERTLRDLAFPLIEPPYHRERWDAVVFEYGEKRDFRRNLWVVDPGAYYAHLMAVNYRSTAARYNQLNDDIRNDIVRIPRFFDIARRVIDADHSRQVTMEALAEITPPERFNAIARKQSDHRLGADLAVAPLRRLSLCPQSPGGFRARGAGDRRRHLARAVAAKYRGQSAGADAAVRPGTAAGRGRRPTAAGGQIGRQSLLIASAAARPGTVHRRARAAPSPSGQAPAPAPAARSVPVRSATR